MAVHSCLGHAVTNVLRAVIQLFNVWYAALIGGFVSQNELPVVCFFAD